MEVTASNVGRDLELGIGRVGRVVGFATNNPNEKRSAFHFVGGLLCPFLPASLTSAIKSVRSTFPFSNGISTSFTRRSAAHDTPPTFTCRRAHGVAPHLVTRCVAHTSQYISKDTTSTRNSGNYCFQPIASSTMSAHVEAFLEENSDLTVDTITASHLWPLLQKLEEESGAASTSGLGRRANILCGSLRQNYSSSMGLAERLRHLCMALYEPSKRGANNNNELLVSLKQK